MVILVRYGSDAIMTYSLCSYMSWEGFCVNINGDKGRIVMKIVEQAYINAGGEESALCGKQLTVYPMFGKPYAVDIDVGDGGHGGGDPILLEDLFGTPTPDPSARAASHVDGAVSILTGIAAGAEVRIDDLVRW